MAVRRDLKVLYEEARKGHIRAIGRLLTIIENAGPRTLELLEMISKDSGKAHVIGVTGIPGAGKSTLISRLIGGFRSKGYRVGVVAIDPSSPISHGSLMGDRLRMQEYSTDKDVFIRSLSTRGLKGGLSTASLAVIEALDALGYDKIIVETVGVGQSDVDIMNAAHTIIVVTMPGAGDDVQALKAGVMEIGDIYVVNKSDKPEAVKTFEYLKFSLDKGDIGYKTGRWAPRLVKTSAIMMQGIDELVDVVEEHWRYVNESGLLAEKLASRRALLAKLILERMFDESLEESMRTLLKSAYAGDGVKYREIATRLAESAIESLYRKIGHI